MKSMNFFIEIKYIFYEILIKFSKIIANLLPEFSNNDPQIKYISISNFKPLIAPRGKHSIIDGVISNEQQVTRV